jgi:hypothetical protein
MVDECSDITRSEHIHHREFQARVQEAEINHRRNEGGWRTLRIEIGSSGKNERVGNRVYQDTIGSRSIDPERNVKRYPKSLQERDGDVAARSVGIDKPFIDLADPTVADEAGIDLGVEEVEAEGVPPGGVVVGERGPQEADPETLLAVERKTVLPLLRCREKRAVEKLRQQRDIALALRCDGGRRGKERVLDIPEKVRVKKIIV